MQILNQTVEEQGPETSSLASPPGDAGALKTEIHHLGYPLCSQTITRHICCLRPAFSTWQVCCPRGVLPAGASSRRLGGGCRCAVSVQIPESGSRALDAPRESLEGVRRNRALPAAVKGCAGGWSRTGGQR